MKRTIIIRDPDPAPDSERARTVRAVITVACALIADGLQWVVPPLWPVADGVMVIVLLLIWGWRWEIAVAVIPELIPGLALCPTWTLFAGYIIVTQRKAAGGPPQLSRDDMRKLRERR